jgi:hypothetical protein
MTTIKVPRDGHLQEVKLHPCPFCGSDPKCDGLPRGVMGQIYCASENCFGPRTTSFTKVDSVTQWNTRVVDLARVRDAIAKTRTNLAGLSKSDDDIYAAMVRRLDGALPLKMSQS